MTVYYVDATDGSDASAGTSVGTAWATIGKALGASGISSGDTVHIAPGTYRELVNVLMTSATVETFVLGDTRGEIAWTTPRSGPVIATAYTTNDKTAPSSAALDLNQRDYLTFERIEFVGGSTYCANALSSASDQASNITLRDCTFYSPGSTYNFYIRQDTSGSAPALDWLFERCAFVSNSGRVIVRGEESASANLDIGVAFNNCLFVCCDSADVLDLTAGVSLTNKPGGVVVRACTVLCQNGIRSNSTEWSTTTQHVVEGCVIVADQNGIRADTSGQVSSDYNIIDAGTPYTNVTGGTNDETAWAPLIHFGQEWITKSGRVRPFGMPTAGSPLIGQVANASHPTEDAAGRPRPGSGNALDTVGWLERANMGTQETSTTQAGSNALKMTGPQVHEFEVAVAASSTTINVYTRYDTLTYDDTSGFAYPSMTVLHCEEAGVTEATDTATASAADAWEQLSLTFTPSSAGIVTVRFESGTLDSDGICYFDTFSVS